MNAIALVLCSVIAGADVRETIPTSRQLYEIIARTTLPVPLAYADWPRIVSNDGAKIELFGPRDEYPVLSKLAELQPSVIAELVVVPCPDRSDCVLAGYLTRWVNATRGGALFTESCVLVDVTNDRVYPIVSSKNLILRHGVVPAAERQISDSTLRAFAGLLVTNVAEFPSQYGFDKQYNLFLGQFDERTKVKVTCEVARIDMIQGRATFYLVFSGGEKRERITFTKPIAELLASKYAVPVGQYLKQE